MYNAAEEVVGATAQPAPTPDSVSALPVSNMKQRCRNMVCGDTSDNQLCLNPVSALNLYVSS